jgi:hypothetical protein
MGSFARGSFGIPYKSADPQRGARKLRLLLILGVEVMASRTRQPKGGTMSAGKLAEIKEKLGQGTSALSPGDIAWLVKRVDELEQENEWLRKELSYAEHQGEVGF